MDLCLRLVSHTCSFPRDWDLVREKVDQQLEYGFYLYPQLEHISGTWGPCAALVNRSVKRLTPLHGGKKHSLSMSQPERGMGAQLSGEDNELAASRGRTSITNELTYNRSGGRHTDRGRYRVGYIHVKQRVASERVYG